MANCGRFWVDSDPQSGLTPTSVLKTRLVGMHGFYWGAERIMQNSRHPEGWIDLKKKKKM